MSMSNQFAPGRQQSVSILHHLIDACREGEIGFRRAADHARSKAVKGILTRYALQRSRFAHELEIEVRLLGGPEKTALSTGAHRRLSILPDAGSPDATLVSDCERLEQEALATFDDVLRARLPAELASLIRGHQGAISDAQNHLRQLHATLAPR